MNSGIIPKASRSSGSVLFRFLLICYLRHRDLALYGIRVLCCPYAADYLIESDERAAADEENFFRVDLDIFLVRMFAATLRRNVAAAAFQDLEKRLLDAFAGNIPRDGDIIRLAPDLIDFIDVNDADLGTFHVVVGIL